MTGNLREERAHDAVEDGVAQRSGCVGGFGTDAPAARRDVRSRQRDPLQDGSDGLRIRPPASVEHDNCVDVCDVRDGTGPSVHDVGHLCGGPRRYDDTRAGQKYHDKSEFSLIIFYYFIIFMM